MTKRILTTAAVLGMVIGLLAGAIGSVAAAAAPPISWIFFPSVPNGQTIEGTGPWFGSITIQNTENDWVNVNFATTASGTPLTNPPTISLPANASETLSSATLFQSLPNTTTNSGFAVEATWDTAKDTATHTAMVAPVIAGVEKQATPENNTFAASTTSSDLTVDGYSAIQAPDVSWGPSSTICNSPTAGCNDFGSNLIGTLISGLGTAKSFNGMSYLPIVQANWSGWDTLLNVTNIDASSPANAAPNVTVTFYQAGSGTPVTNKWTGNIAAGQTAQIDVASIVGSSAFVGSAQISSSYAMVANTVRVKASTNMAIINTSAPSLLTAANTTTTNVGGVKVIYPTGTNAFSLYAPLVYHNYQGWNTGINIVNTSSSQDTITVTFYNQDGSTAAASPALIPANGMQYVYIPATANSGPSSFGSATISGNEPFYAAVDEVKYSTGDAMSYMATGSTMTPATIAGDNTLALPLFQNGSVGTDNVEHGDASGINLSNPSGTTAATGSIVFYDNAGSQEPTVTGPISLNIPANGSTYVYAPSMTGLATNIQLSAIVTVSNGQMAAVSNNVNYDVSGDGGSVFVLSSPYGQYRFGCTGSTCGIQAVVAPTS